jgi:peptidoglycan hydrolase CwlO-like protein
MDVSIVISLISLAGSVTGAYFIYRASVKATNVEDKKVDQAAYDRAIEFYQKQLDDMTKQIDRATAQVDRLNLQIEKMSSQLGAERDVSNALKSQVAILKAQVEVLNDTMSELKSRVGQRIKPSHPPLEESRH